MIAEEIEVTAEVLTQRFEKKLDKDAELVEPYNKYGFAIYSLNYEKILFEPVYFIYMDDDNMHPVASVCAIEGGLERIKKAAEMLIGRLDAGKSPWRFTKD